MITLTTPPEVNSVLGGAAKTAYDRFVLSSLTYSPRNKTLTATIEILVSVDAQMSPITGSLNIDLNTKYLQITVSQLDFYRRVLLTNAQITTVQGWIDGVQAQVESGLVSLGLIAGVQAPGV